MFEEIKWHQELSWEEAARRLEVAMYPFKKVNYLPFTEAFDRAKAENKLVHSILLWGPWTTSPAEVPGGLSGRLSWKARPYSLSSTRASSVPGPW